MLRAAPSELNAWREVGDDAAPAPHRAEFARDSDPPRAAVRPDVTTLWAMIASPPPVVPRTVAPSPLAPVSRRYRYDLAPLRVYWEVTRACDLACRHCRADAAPRADPDELDHAEGRRLLERIAAFGAPPPKVVLTGGDPLKRADLFDLIAYARGLGLGVSVAPSATPLLTPRAIRDLKAGGVEAISLSLDGATAGRHDAIRGIPGTFDRTVAAARAAFDAGLAFQVNTLVCAETVDDMPAIHALVTALGAARWSLFFLVSVGRGAVLEAISPERSESLLGWLADLRGRHGPIATTTEAPHLRRVLHARQAGAPVRDVGGDLDTRRSMGHGIGRSMSGRPIAGHPTSGHPHAAGHNRPGAPVAHGAGVRDGNGVMFVSHTGDICPSGFLEISAGNARADDPVAVYRDAALFRDLREPDGFGGRCGRCEFRLPCGGSRARAYAASGDLLGEDPLCTYEPSVPHDVSDVPPWS